MQLLESGQDYLETILILKESKGFVRSIDIVHHLGYSKPSVSVAMKRLREAGYIMIDAEGYIQFTQMGLAEAERIYMRHRLLTKFFVQLGVDEKTAAADACKVEHDLSDTTFEKIVEHTLSAMEESERALVIKKEKEREYRLRSAQAYRVDLDPNEK